MADDVDLACDNNERYLNSAIYGVTKALAVDPALALADDCEECGDGIPPERLAAVPWTRLCVDCAARREREARGR